MLYIPYPFRRCSKCRTEYLPSLKYFRRRPEMKDGMQSICRVCDNANHKHYRHTHPEICAQIQKRSRQKHIDKARERDRIYSRKHQPERNKYARQYWKRYKIQKAEKIQTRNQRRRNRARQVIATFDEANWQQALIYWSGLCAYCGNPPSLFDNYKVLHQDHFRPLDKGGAYTPDNIVPACQFCNFSKSDKDAHEWLTTRYGARKAARILKRIADYFAWVKSQSEHD